MPDDFSADALTTGRITIGGWASGVRDEPVDADWFAVDLEQGQEYVFSAYRSEHNGEWYNLFPRLTDADGNTLAMPEGFYQHFSYTPTDTTTYFFEVYNNHGFITDYELRVALASSDEISDDVTTTGAVEFDTPIEGMADDTSDNDWYAVDLEMGQIISIEGQGTASPAGAITPIRFNIHDHSGGEAIQYGNWPSTALQTELFTAPEAGRYYVAVKPDFVYAGPYSFTVTDITVTDISDDFSADTGTQGVLTDGASITSIIETVHDRDWFAVELLADTPYVFDLEGTATQSGTLYDPYLYGLFDSAGRDTGQGYNDDGGIGVNSRGVVNVSESGTYFISAGDISDNTGSYTLSLTSLEDDFINSPDTTGALTVDGAVDGAIEYGGDVDWIAVTLDAHTVYSFEASTPDDLTDPESDVLISGLFDADGQNIQWPYSDTLHYVSSGAETVFLQVEGNYTSDVGQYRLSAEALYTPSDRELAALNDGAIARSFDAAQTPYYQDTIGSLGRDALLGTSEDDIMRGLAGADTLLAGAGDDILVGDDGMASNHHIMDATRVYRAYDAILGRTHKGMPISPPLARRFTVMNWQMRSSTARNSPPQTAN